MLSKSYRDGDVDLQRDHGLLDRCQRGDRRAFEELYLLYRERLYRFCLRRLNDPSEAEDTVQEVFARAWKALPGFAGERRFYSWLTVIASNLCADAQRQKNRLTPVGEEDLQALVPAVAGDADFELERAVQRDLLSRALDNLSDRHREVLELREGRNWTYQQIAAHEGVAVSTIETLLFRARRSLKHEFMQLARAEGALGVLLGPLFALRRIARRVSSAVRTSATVVKSTLAAVSSPTGPIGGVVASAATAAVVASSVAIAGASAQVASTPGPRTTGDTVAAVRSQSPAPSSVSPVSSAQGVSAAAAARKARGAAHRTAAPGSVAKHNAGTRAGIVVSANPGTSGTAAVGGLLGSAASSASGVIGKVVHTLGTGLRHLPPITVPPITVPPITVPPITVPPITVPPITVPKL